MNLQDLIKCVDHTLLSPTATQNDFNTLCDEALEYKPASVCVPPSAVINCVNYLENKIPVCTVVGFPNGYNSSETKAFEAALAVEQGAKEIDMVINLNFVKSKDYKEVLRDILYVRKVTEDAILKVIIETSSLTEDEKITLCTVISSSGADFIKTSTGFGSGGATPEDIILFKEHIAQHVKIKASGGIQTPEDGFKFLELGASRLGTSKIIKLAKAGGKITEGY